MSEGVCSSQTQFSNAVQVALDDYEKPEPTSAAYVASIIAFVIWILFLIYALYLALKSKNQRFWKLILAVVCPPLFVVAYMIDQLAPPGKL